ncbi:putative SOS response-associated peptidase YedK [Leucobacter exalbidus]|uniref:Abasic site processing protein n=1 Tax=Leucobacter exalbidus TaxID=662960 RepID=A0A940PLW3_9MICO|nr:putative SOS response-associated peptidase YedK [Leucobacter exalbidus]
MDYEEMLRVAGDTALAEWLTAAPQGAASSWNIPPTRALAIALTDPVTGSKHFELAHWSLAPPWAKQLNSKFPTFNARAETAAEKPTFQAAVQHARCAIPVSGFYEWTGSKERRVPHAIFGPAPVLILAGLYSWWRAPGSDDRWTLTTTILTQPSAGKMTDLHDRMPVFLADELTAEWLDPATLGDQHLVNAVTAMAISVSCELRTHEVRPLRGDGAHLMDPMPRASSPSQQAPDQLALFGEEFLDIAPNERPPR